MTSEEIEPHIYRKFEILQRLGKGAYGIVWKAIERKTRHVVAVKKVFDAFHNDTDAQRTFREVMILQELDHENMVKLLNVIKAENNKDLYLIFEYMETDLHAVIRAGILEEIHKVFIIYQILKSLLYLHSAEIIHRDLKPSNVLINSECLVKIADFGLARSVQPYDNETAPIMTEYVATRWYRAPEIVLGSSQYSKAVDMWSVGCILGELITGKAIFPGRSTINQIELILDLLGKPKPEDLEEIGGTNDWNIINSINSKQRHTFQSFFKNCSKEALDFLKRSLEFNPKKRLTVEEALRHPFVKQFHDPSKELKSPKIIDIPISDQKRMSIREYREALYADILRKKKEQRRQWQMAYLQQLGINVNDVQGGSSGHGGQRGASGAHAGSKGSSNSAFSNIPRAEPIQQPSEEEQKKYDEQWKKKHMKESSKEVEPKHSKPKESSMAEGYHKPSKPKTGSMMQYEDYVHTLFKGKKNN